MFKLQFLTLNTIQNRTTSRTIPSDLHLFFVQYKTHDNFDNTSEFITLA